MNFHKNGENIIISGQLIPFATSLQLIDYNYYSKLYYTPFSK